MSVTVIGTVALDSIKTPQGEREKILGGSGMFAAMAASLFGPVHLVSIVGDDFSPAHQQTLSEKGIDLSGLAIIKGEKTFSWTGEYQGDMQEAITKSTDLNVLLQFDPVIPESAKSSKVVFCANCDPVVQKKAIEQFTNPQCVILDTMNYYIDNHLSDLKAVLPLVDIFVLNDQEAKMLTGEPNLIIALDQLRTLGPKQIIIKKGAHGSIFYNGQTYFMCPAMPLKKLVDPTGAGDTFAGSLAGVLSSSNDSSVQSIKKGVIAGAVVSSNTVQGFSIESIQSLNTDTIVNQEQQLLSYCSL